MSNVELVIKIPKEDYESIKNDVKKFLSMPSHKVPVLYEAVNEGILLPKGHGDLIDISKLPVTTTCFGISDKPMEVVNYNCILNAKKIIKTDKAESEEV